MVEAHFINKDLTMLPLSQIEPNGGQLDGLPKNPRSIRGEKFRKLKGNIEAYPEMLAWRSLLVYPLDSGKYIIIGGNMRYRAMAELGHTEAPVFIIPKDTPVKRLQAYTIIDNNGFGEWDWDLLANEWPDDMLADWGLDIPNIEDEELSKRAGWNTAEDAKESVCDMVEHLSIYRRDELLFASFFKKSEEGVPLSLIKSEENVSLFVDMAVRVIKGLVRMDHPEGWSLVTAPRRRHKDWNFGDTCCQFISQRLGIPYYADAFESKDRNRIRPEFHLLKEIEEPNVIVFDDILTTGSTLRAMAALLVGKNTLFVVGINNN